MFSSNQNCSFRTRFQSPLTAPGTFIKVESRPNPSSASQKKCQEACVSSREVPSTAATQISISRPLLLTPSSFRPFLSFANMEAINAHTKRPAIIEPDSEDEIQRCSSKRPKIASFDALSPNNVSGISVLQAAIATVMKAEKSVPCKIAGVSVSSSNSSLSGCSTQRTTRCLDQDSPPGGITSIQVPSSPLADHTELPLRHPLSHETLRMPRVIGAGGLPLGMPLMAPPRLPQLSSGKVLFSSSKAPAACTKKDPERSI